MSLKSTLKKLNPLSSSSSSSSKPSNESYIFPQTDPAIDGDACLHDCETCTIHLPRKWHIDEDDHLYGEINGFSRHVVVATGKSDWVREVADEKGSVMEAVGRWKDENERGGKKDPDRIMLSASNIPLPDQDPTDADTSTQTSIREQQAHGTTVLLLPAFLSLRHVTPSSIPTLLSSPFFTSTATSSSTLPPSPSTPPSSLPAGIEATPIPHNAIILLCSQKTRDARCGQSAPLLRREFERHLRPLGLYRDLHDERPEGVGIYFISHVGGHKYSANVMVYRSTAMGRETGGVPAAPAAVAAEGQKQAMQCIWLARVRPEDCENIVRFTVLQGKVVKPQRQLRGGFDREKGVCSW